MQIDQNDCSREMIFDTESGNCQHCGCEPQKHIYSKFSKQVVGVNEKVIIEKLKVENDFIISKIENNYDHL